MAIPDHLLGKHFIRGFNQSPAVADLPRESPCDSLDPLLNMVMYRQLPDAMITPDTKVDIEIKKGGQKGDTADTRWRAGCYGFFRLSSDGVDLFVSVIAPMDLRMRSYLWYCKSSKKDQVRSSSAFVVFASFTVVLAISSFVLELFFFLFLPPF
jgi:hypothetical protein